MAISAPPAPTAPPAARPAEAVTDAELVAAIRRGSDRAFEQLYARYHRRIAAYIYGMVRDEGRAEDISQDVFMSALRRMRGTDRPITFKPWIYEIAKNACIDQFRRSRRGEEISYDAEDGRAAAESSRLVASAPSPAAQVDQKVAIDNLRGAFGGLSRTHHEVLVMREFEGLSYQEIGQRLDMSRASVESTLFRARRRLAEEYEELVSGERCQRVQELIVLAGGTVPGVRNQRRLSAHLAHCQPCRREARYAGLDEALFVAPRRVRAKVAAFFPLPAFLQRRWGADPTAAVPTPGPSLSALAQLSAQFAGSIDPAFASWAKAVAAAATIAVAGAAGGAAVSDQSREFFGGAALAQRGAAAQPRSGAPSIAGSASPAGRPALKATPGTGTAGPSATKGATRPGATAGGSAPAPAARRTPGAAGTPAAPASAAQVPELTPETIVGALSPKALEPAPPAGNGAGDGSTAAVKAMGTQAAADAAAAAAAAAATVANDKQQVEGVAGTTVRTGADVIGEKVGTEPPVLGG